MLVIGCIFFIERDASRCGKCKWRVQMWKVEIIGGWGGGGGG